MKNALQALLTALVALASPAALAEDLRGEPRFRFETYPVHEVYTGPAISPSRRASPGRPRPPG